MGLIVTPESLVEDAYSFFAGFLETYADRPYSALQVVAGLEPEIYNSLADLQAAIPIPSAVDDTTAPPTEPNFAIINDETVPELKLAYWNWPAGAGGSWAETTFPWGFPFLQAGHIIDQSASTLAGNNLWNYVMGPEIQIQAAGTIVDLTVKFGTGGTGHSHRWELLRSTSPGPTAPALATYTDLLDSGTFLPTLVNTWQSVGLAGTYGVAVNDWIHPRAWQGPSSGQSAFINTLRTGGLLVEDYGTLENGLYVLDNVAPPGTIPSPLPTIRNTTTLFGAVSVEFAP